MMKNHIQRRRSAGLLIAIAMIASIAIGAQQVSSTGEVGNQSTESSIQIRIHEGAPFVVPHGTRLIVQTIGYSDAGFGVFSGSFILEADGLPIVAVQNFSATGLVELQHGIQFNAGESVSVRDLSVMDPSVALGRLLSN